MPDVIFPADLAKNQDSKKFAVEQEDNAIKGETEGGYVSARRRHTRKPRKTFTIGYTDLPHAIYLQAIAFYELVGTWQRWIYTDPTTGVTYKVRFEKPPKWDYVGMGVAKLWSTSGIALKEA